MFSKSRASTLALLAGVLFFAPVASAAAPSDVASVNGVAISRSDFDAKLEASPQAKPALNLLVEQILIEKYAVAHHVQVSDDEVLRQEAEIRAKLQPGQFNQIIASQNLSEGDVRTIIRDQLELVKEVTPTLHISDAEVADYFAKNRVALGTPEQVRARHILVAGEATARKLEAQLKNGASFAALAAKYSMDPGTKANGGELGFFSRGQMVPQFDHAAFTQKVGVVGPPVKSSFGWHIIQVEEHKAGRVATLANSRAQILGVLADERERTEAPKFVKQLEADSKVVLDPLPYGSEAASVDGSPVSRDALDRKLENLPVAKSTLTEMIETRLVDQYALDNHVTITDAELKQREDDIRAKYPPGQFDETLKARNLDATGLHDLLRREAILEKGLSAKIHISDADVQAYLDKNHATLDTSEQVRARHILVGDEATAKSIETQLSAGAKFDELAKTYSLDPGSKDKGGELGFFGRNVMVKPFEDAAFSQAIGVVGPPVKSQFGWHVIEVEEKKAARVATLENSRDAIVQTLTEQQRLQQLPAFMANLRSGAKIVILDSRYKDAFGNQ